jgi:outer membrane murein-binding lipoprotein Lpp
MRWLSFLFPRNRTHRQLMALAGAIDHLRRDLMSAISDFAAKQAAHNAAIDTAITGLSGDVQALKSLVEQLQNSAGQVTPEDQALLDQIESQTGAIADRLTALDAETPPTPPTE